MRLSYLSIYLFKCCTVPRKYVCIKQASKQADEQERIRIVNNIHHESIDNEIISIDHTIQSQQNKKREGRINKYSTLPTPSSATDADAYLPT